MMQDVNVEPSNELRTIEIGQTHEESVNGSPSPSNAVEQHSTFGPGMCGSDEEEASEVDSFSLDENEIEDSEHGLQEAKLLLAAEAEQGIQTVDPQTQARLEALLEAAGISKLSHKDGKALSDPEVLRTLTSSVSSALDEAAQALNRMRDSQGQPLSAEGVQLEAGAESESLSHRSGHGAAADASEEGESLLSLACSAGYYELAQVLLAMKANVEDRGIKGDCTPLMEAASGGHVDIVRLLLLHNADINAQSSAGNTPLHYGACGGFKEVVEELIKNGANVEIHNENGHTPLMEAASAGHVDVAKILLEHGAGINTHSNEFKESALTLACYKGHLDMVKFLLEAGADQEHKTDEMHTALMEASMDGHVEVARLLLDSGAQVNMPADSFESPLTLAACGGHIELASLLIERGANIEEVNDEGYTPLMEAAREGHEDMVALLLSHDADINAQTEETQETALTLACCGGFLEVADFLLRSGAFIELGCSTPLMEAAQEGHLELVSFLLQSGANVEAHTGTGDTALTYACENGHTDVAEALLECGAKLEHESEGGRTPLMKAARAGHLCTVQFLISKGADVNRSTTSNDHTVLSLACAGGHLAVVDLLLQHNADPNHKLKDGSTMVIEAAKGGHTQVVKLLLEWPNRFLVNSATEQLAQLNVADVPAEEPRVPVQGLANIVPPGEPDPQIPNVAVSLANAIHGKAQKSSIKRSVIGQADKAGNKFSGTAENLPQLFTESVIMDDKAIEKDEKLSQASKEEQILRKQQILEELKKVELELQEKAQQQLQFNTQADLEQQQQMQAKLKQATTLSAPGGPAMAINKAEWNEELAKLFELPSQTDTLNQFSDFAKLMCDLEPTASPPSTEAYFQQLLMQHQNQVQSIQLSAPPPPPPTLASPSPHNNAPPVEGRAGGGGKNGGTKRNGTNKQGRTVKNLSQALQQPPPPPPPPPPQSLVHPGKGSRLLPLSTQQQLLTPAQPIVFQNEHNGGSQSVETSQVPASTAQAALDTAQRQQLQVQQQQQQQLPLAYSPLLAPGQAPHELLQHMLTSQQGIQHQLQMQQITQQVQAGQHVLQGVNAPQVSPAPPGQLSAQQHQQYQQQQQQAHLLHQHLQQLRGTSTPAAGNHTVAINKPQVVRKQQRVPQTTTQTNPYQNSVVNVDETLAQAAGAAQTSAAGIPGAAAAAAGVGAGGLYANVDVDSQTESNHDTALTLACAGGHAELVSLLLAKGADIEHRDKKGFTPLILAATTGHVEVVEILLNLNADIEAQSERTKDTPLSLACSGGRYEVVELLLNKGANKEHRNVSDYTPLSLAASGGYVNIIKLLLSHNAEINSRTGSKLGISPLMLAAMNGHTAAVKLLLDMGSDINAQIETNRNTALTLACFQGRHEVVSLLVDRKANIEHRAKTGLTPLMEAASGGYVEVGRVLLDKGADVNAPPVPSSRDTALTIAADKGHYRFVELLLHRGASVDVKNKKGNSPLWLACNGGHNDVVSLLVQADADIDSQDNRKVSCLMAAFRRGHLKVVKWMVKKVTQFPSENEIKRYIATITDKELQKKCNQCADVIVTAKDRQAAEANKNADSLLEEIKQEKEQAAHKAEMASKRRERRRERKKKGKQKDDKEKENNGKNSSPEPDGDSGKKDDDDEEDEDDDDSSNHESSSVSSTNLTKRETPTQSSKSKAGSNVSSTKVALENSQPARLPPTTNTAPVISLASASSSPSASTTGTITTAASARANRDARKKQQKAAREIRREASGMEVVMRHSAKVELNKKVVTEALQVTLAKVTTLIESVVTVTASGSQANSHSSTLVSSSQGGHSIAINGPRVPSGGTNINNNGSSIHSSSSSSGKEHTNNTGVNGNKSSRTKKSNEIKQSTGIGELDDFGVPITSVLKNLANGKTGMKKSNDKRDMWIDDCRFLEKTLPVNRLTSSAPSPRKGQKKEEGWKEVVRKNVSKKLSVPANVTARLIGKGGCNINAIREISGAHVEVEKAKGSADRTVTIKGCPEAIKQANNLINAMVEEPDKDISEILSQVTKSHKISQPSSEKSHHHPHHQPAPLQQQKTSIKDFAIGTFTLPATTSSSSAGNGKSPAQSRSSRQGSQTSGSTRIATSSSMGPTIGAWQNPVPGQPTPSSPRRSPLKLVTPSPATAGAGRSSSSSSMPLDKSSARQLVFGASDQRSNKRSSSPTPVATATSSASLTFTATATTTIRGSVSSTTVAASTSQTKGAAGPRQQLNQIKSSMAVGSASSTMGGRFPRPVNTASGRMDPLPIVTSGSTSHNLSEQGQTNSSGVSGQVNQQPTVGEYSPFHNNVFNNFLSKKEEPIDKMDFASVAAAGVVTTSPSSQTTTNAVQANSNTVDPALQAKAPGFKIPQRSSSPPYRPTDADPSISSYRLSSGGSSAVGGALGPSQLGGVFLRQGSALPQTPSHLMDNQEYQMLLHYQRLHQMNEHAIATGNFNTMMHPTYMRMEFNRGMAGGMPHGLMPQGMGGIHLGPQVQPPLPQKEEYSQPHRPMQLPEIKGALNPNAPEFQLPPTGQPMMNGFDSAATSLFSSMMGMGRQGLGPVGSDAGQIPNPGSGGLSGLNQGSLPPMMQPADLMATANMQYLLQQSRSGPGMVAGGGQGAGGNSPPQLGPNSLSSNSSMGQNSPPQGLIGPSAISPSPGSAFLSQSQGSQSHQPHSPMPTLPGGRPNSAPSVQQEPGPIGPPKSGSPMSSHTPPLEQPKPIGMERRRGSGRQGPGSVTFGGSNPWGLTNSTAYGQEWSNSNSPVMSSASLPSSVITSSVLPGGNMVYQRGLGDQDDEGSMDYGLQAPMQYSDGMPTGDGDHNLASIMYGNGPYPMDAMFNPKAGGAGDSQTPPLWNSSINSAPSDQGDSERWKTWSQQSEL